MTKSYKLSIYFDVLSKNIALYEGFRHLKERKLTDHFKMYESYKDFSSFVDYLLNPFLNIPTSDLGEDVNYLIKLRTEIKGEIKDRTDYHFKNFNINKFIEFENITLLFFMFSEFENYLFKCFKYIIIRNPEILFEKQISIENIINKIKDLKFDSKDEIENEEYKTLFLNSIIEDFTERIIHDKLYENYEEVFTYAQKVLGIKHDIESRALKLFNLFKQFRNLYSHGDGIISYIFLNKVKKIGYKTKYFKLGEKLIVDNELIDDVRGMIFFISSSFDKALIGSYPELNINIEK